MVEQRLWRPDGAKQWLEYDTIFHRALRRRGVLLEGVKLPLNIPPLVHWGSDSLYVLEKVRIGNSVFYGAIVPPRRPHAQRSFTSRHIHPPGVWEVYEHLCGSDLVVVMDGKRFLLTRPPKFPRLVIPPGIEHQVFNYTREPTAILIEMRNAAHLLDGELHIHTGHKP